MDIENQLFFVTQDAIITNEEGKVLILCHNSDPDRWLLPGGKIKKNESWIEGLRREVKEETGITELTIDKIIDISSWIEPEAGYYVVTFLCSVSSEKTKNIKISNEHKKYAWVIPDESDKYNFWHPDIKKRIQKTLLR